MIQDFFKFALESIKRRRLRSMLTMIGIFIGIAAVVSLISLGQGLQSSISDQFKQIGTDKIFVSPGSGFGPPGSSAQKLTQHDVDVIKSVNGVKGVAAVSFKFADALFNNKAEFLPFYGVPLKQSELAVALESQNNVKAEFGRTVQSGDKFKVMIGYDLANIKELFGKVVKLRDKISINGYEFEVVGIAKRVGNPSDDKVVYAPIDTVFQIYNITNQFDYVFVKTEVGSDPTKVADAIKDKMRRDRGLKKGEEDFQVQTFQNIANTFASIFDIVQAVIIGIAAISLVVGGVGIMNTMYMTVLEHTKEIGVMKAIGARNSHIMQIFLFESGIYGLVGGIVGVLLGIGIAKLTEVIATNFIGTTLLRAEISPWLIIGVLLFSFTVGMLSGAAPAYRASKFRPVQALRYE